MTDMAKRSDPAAFAAACNLRLEQIIRAQNAQIRSAQPASLEAKNSNQPGQEVLHRLIERIKSI